MKLGALLLRDGLLSDDQLDRAVAEQQRSGGRLGTVLVELGLVDLETLTVYLGLELGMPVATGTTLDRAKHNAVRMLTPQQAIRHRCVPLIAQDRTLIAAIDDPLDLVTLDELARITGCRIIPRVAPEIRIYYYLERYYGVPRPRRFRLMGESPRGVGRARSALAPMPVPSLPGLPPVAKSLVAAPTPSPTVRPISATSAENARAVELEAHELESELDADEGEVAAPAKSAPADGAIGSPPENTPRPAPALVALDAESAIEAMTGALQRSDIAAALLGYACRLFDVAAVMVVRDGLAIGWKGFGAGLDPDRIEALLVPLEVSSIYQQAVSGDGLYAGPVTPSAIHDHVFRLLRCASPKQAVVSAVTIGRRVVNVLHGHRSAAEVPPEALDELRRVAAAASDAYVRLIASSKRRRGP